jgi:hypothetical protein
MMDAEMQRRRERFGIREAGWWCWYGLEHPALVLVRDVRWLNCGISSIIGILLLLLPNFVQWRSYLCALKAGHSRAGCVFRD